MALSEELRRELEQIIRGNDVVLFMKGTKDRPACGFSATVVSILDEYVDDYRSVNVLERSDVREGIKEYSSWPTIPQLYVKGELVGGSDIVRGLETSGELAKLLGVPRRVVKAPELTVTPAAAEQLRAAASEAPSGSFLRFEVDPRFQYGLGFDQPAPNDFQVAAGGITILIDPSSARRADGVTIDFLERPGGGGFKIDNPQEPPKVKPIGARELKNKLDAKEPIDLIDVRTEEERKIAQLPGARLLDEATDAHLRTLDRERTVVFFCHHGQRSLQAAQHYLSLGFKRVFNLDGGIDAWSREVDSTVPRY